MGQNLGKSFLYYAPLLGSYLFASASSASETDERMIVGYRGSVFNLVYVSNFASLKIWDSLDFQRVGLIPKAGRLKSRVEGGEDEFTDAIVYHKTF